MMQIGDINETELVGLVRAGDSSAARSLYDLYSKYLTAVCSRYITDEHDLGDVLQDSFVKIFTSIDRFEYRGKGSLKAWMTRIVVNESLTKLKSRRKSSLLLYESDLPDLPEQEPPDIGDIPQQVIHEMIRNLPTGYRTVFNLYVFEGRSHKQIAELLGIAESSSASQLHRAKNILARQIKEYENNKRMTI